MTNEQKPNETTDVVTELKDKVGRYAVIGSSLDRLHRILFGTTYDGDLEKLVCTDFPSQSNYLQKKRNAFMHVTSEAINNEVVGERVQLLRRFHETWIRAFNLRCRQRTAPESPR